MTEQYRYLLQLHALQGQSLRMLDATKDYTVHELGANMKKFGEAFDKWLEENYGKIPCIEGY